MRSTIRSLGHFGLDIRMGAARVVCDPWLGGGGAYLGSRHPFPDNSHLRAEELHDAPNLVITSPRPDHFDVETLRGLPNTTRVIVPVFPSRTLADGIRALGFTELVELADGQPFDLGEGATLELIAGATKHVLESTLVLSAGGETIVHQNDCRLDDAALARLASARPQLHFLQFSGASHAPAALDLAPAEMQAAIDAAKAELLSRFFATARAVGARTVVPTGGPTCFVDERRFELNFDGSIFFDTDELVERTAALAPELVDRLQLLYPGDLASGQDGDWRFETRKPYDDKRRHLEEIRRVRGPAREAALAELRALAQPVDGKELRSYLRDFFQFEDMTYKMEVLVEVRLREGPSVWVDFRKRPVRYLTESEEPAGYVLTLESAFMSLVLQEKVSFHDLLMGLEATLSRDPREACPPLMSHLDYRHDPALFDLVRRLDPALITVSDEEMEYVCQKFCPHRGRDLEYAIIERGKLTCTAHGWRFDLRKEGKCLWGGDAPLFVKEVRPLKR